MSNATVTATTFDTAAAAEHLKGFLVDALFIDMDPKDIGDEMLLGTEVGVDSLGFAELMAHIEDEYNVSISDGEFVPDNFSTVARIVELVAAKITASS
ncbi:acyl carrier protein [Streptomyces sp. NPDC058221]|uniref:acyl carrier protein n=1 Tax=Streptomyces sp. NPDC058221 TaxID=3346388 RepID=UPI0036EA2D47